MEGGIPRCSDDHSLTPTYDNDADEFCKMCGLACKGWIYSCKLHSFNIHKTCAELKREITHPFHSHKLTLLNKPPYSSGNFQCHACGKVVRFMESPNFGYRNSATWPTSNEEKEWTTAPLTIYSALHEHQLTFFRAAASDLCCNICQLQSNSNHFRCVTCNFNIHFLCISTMPPIVKCKSHLHPLTLTTSLIKDHDNEDEFSEFFCDVCEHERKLSNPTYYCAKCHFVAHIQCAIPEIMNEMKDEWSLAHKHGDTTSTHSLQEDTGNDDIDEEIEALCTEIKQERVALNELRRKYVDEQVLKIEKSKIKLEALRKKRKSFHV